MTSGTLSALMPLQRRIIVLIVDGETNQEIAERLNLDVGSIHPYVRALMRQLGMALDVDPAELDPDASGGRTVRSMTDSAERPGETQALTSRQLDILVLIVNGLTNRQIAEQLGVSPGLVGTHIGRITSELGLTSRAELVAMGTGGRPR